MSADALIGNLLEKKDTFTFKPGAHGKQMHDGAPVLGHPSEVLFDSYFYRAILFMFNE